MKGIKIKLHKYHTFTYFYILTFKERKTKLSKLRIQNLLSTKTTQLPSSNVNIVYLTELNLKIMHHKMTLSKYILGSNKLYFIKFIEFFFFGKSNSLHTEHNILRHLHEATFFVSNK